MRRTLIGLSVILVIGAIVVLVAPLLLSAEDARNKLFAEVEAATGYRLNVAGPIDIGVIPALRLNAEDVSVSKEMDGAYREIATATELRFGLAWTALLGGQVRMTEISLVEPVITVPEAEEPAETVPAAPQSGGEESTSAAIRSLSLDRLTITDGTVILPGQSLNVTDLNLKASLSSFDGPLSVEGKAVYNGDPITIAGSVDSFGPFLDGAAAPVEVSVEAPAYLGQAVTLVGTATYTGATFALQDFTATAGDSAFGGSIAADLSSDIARIKATVNGESLDLDKLMAKAASGGEPTDGAGSAPAASEEPIDFSALQTIAADIDVSLERLVVAGIAVTPLVGSAHAGAGKADIVADILGVGTASGAASLSVDATRDSPYVSGKVRIAGADLAEAGRLAGQALPVTGTAGADIVFATAGRTPSELMARFNASGALSLQNGAATVAGLGDIVGDKGADRIEQIALTATFEDLLKPVSVSGSAAWHGERFDLSGVADVRGILAGKPSAVEAKAASRRVSAGYAGTLSSAGAGSGRVSVETASLTGLMRWLGQEPAWDSGFEAFSLDGRLTVTDASVAFDDASIRLDDTEGTGSGKVVFGKIPTVEARLDLETLNVNPYLGAAGQTASAPAASAAQPAGWSDAPIDLSALRAVNADLALNVKELIYKQIKAGPVAIAATVSGGKLTTELKNLNLYGGKGSGALSVDASGKAPTQTIRFSLDGLDAHPFLRDAAGFSRIEGTGAIAIDVTASGASQRQIVSALGGTAKLEFSNGAIRGINIARMVRSLTSGTLTGWQSGEAEKTDFASLGASFAIANGHAKTDDLHLVGPLVRVSGSGNVDLPAQTLNLRVDPKVVASLEGQGGQDDLEGLGVPVIVAGPWARPQIYPDIAGILQNPQAAYEQLKKLGGGLFNLPNIDLGGSGGGGVADVVKQTTGVSIDDIVKDGKIDQEALQQGAIKGLEQLLQQQGSGGLQIPGLTAPAPQQAPAAAQPPAAASTEAAPTEAAAPAQQGAAVPQPRARPQPPEAPQQAATEPAQDTGGKDKAKDKQAKKPKADDKPADSAAADDDTGATKGKKARKKKADVGGETDDQPGETGAVPEVPLTPEEQAKQLLQNLLKPQ